MHFWMCGQLMLQSNGIVLLYNRIKGLIEPFNGYQHSFQVFFNIVFLLKIATSAESAVCVLFFCCFFGGIFFSFTKKTRSRGCKTFSYSTQLSTKFILLMNIKMSTIFGILTFISIKNTFSERLKARNFFICRYFSFSEQLKFREQF